ncbi:hypothetical protein [Pikeienuella sp. HZG-20]|uniref:hypothetical protein n=1 Tax=Paludibacillus litoralis TaxID=3133267 RepID=UPI0030ED5F44
MGRTSGMGLIGVLGAALLLGAAPGGSAADPTFQHPKAKSGYAYPECYCTNRGVRVEIGEISCLRIGAREFTARCGMSLNNPAWRDKTEGCAPTPLSRSAPLSELSQPG